MRLAFFISFENIEPVYLFSYLSINQSINLSIYVERLDRYLAYFAHPVTEVVYSLGALSMSSRSLCCRSLCINVILASSDSRHAVIVTPKPLTPTKWPKMSVRLGYFLYPFRRNVVVVLASSLRFQHTTVVVTPSSSYSRRHPNVAIPSLSRCSRTIAPIQKIATVTPSSSHLRLRFFIVIPAYSIHRNLAAIIRL